MKIIPHSFYLKKIQFNVLKNEADSLCTRSFWTAPNIRKGKDQNTLNELKIRV